MATDEKTKVILGFPREMKLGFLKDALEQDNFPIFLGLSKILLDAPLNEGGIESEVIEKIHNDYLATLKPKTDE